MLTKRLGWRLGQLAWGLFAASFVAGACGNKDSGAPPRDPATGSGTGGKSQYGVGGTGSGSGGKAGAEQMTAGEGGMAGETGSSAGDGNTAGTTTDPLAPVIHLTSPKALTDPNDPAVIVADEVDALCTVTKSTARGSVSVDSATVVLQSLDAGGNVVEMVPGTPTDNDNEYTGHFITTKITDNGRMSFACLASDSARPPHTASDKVDTFIDHGPKISAVAPPLRTGETALFATAVTDPLHVAFTVDELPVAKGDKGAAVGDVSVTVGGKPFKLTQSNGQYTATVHLDDMTIFSLTPDGDQKIVIVASDKRSPEVATSQLAYDFIVDGTGPVITIESPKAGDVKSGRVQFVIKIADAQSGVDPLSVVATINNKDYRYADTDPSWSYDVPSDTFTFTFDTTQIENSVAQATLHVAASDKVGNKSTQSVTMQLDNVPPIVDLDPFPIRMADTSASCTLAFDPVGPAAASDLQVVRDFQTFRSLVWEETNHASGQTTGIAAGADLNSVRIYLQPNIGQGLLMDTNDDGLCDAIDTQDAKTGADLPSLPMHGLTPQGVAFFGIESQEDASLVQLFPMPGNCNYVTASAEVMSPPFLCPPANDSDMTLVIPWDIDHTVPAIFGLDPIMGRTCTGYGWEIRSVVSEGWICAAATAKDNNGNVGISAPIRLCYDDGVDPPPDCLSSDGITADAASAPSCIEDACVPPVRFGRALLRQ